MYCIPSADRAGHNRGGTGAAHGTGAVGTPNASADTDLHSARNEFWVCADRAARTPGIYSADSQNQPNPANVLQDDLETRSGDIISTGRRDRSRDRVPADGDETMCDLYMAGRACSRGASPTSISSVHAAAGTRRRCLRANAGMLYPTDDRVRTEHAGAAGSGRHGSGPRANASRAGSGTLLR